MGRTDLCEVARRMAWFKPTGAPDTMRVKRTLSRKTVLYRTAVRLADALFLDPFEAGV